MQALSGSKDMLGLGSVNDTGPVIDARARMAVTLLSSLITVIISTFTGQLTLFACSLVYALSVRRYRALVIAYIFVGVMMCIAALFNYGFSLLVPSLPFTWQGLAIPFLRGVVMLNVILPLALASRIQDLLTAMKSLRLPYCIYLPGAVMIRFIPTFINDIKQVTETLKIRGYNVNPGEMTRHPLMMLRLLFTPLLFRSLRSSEELGIAAELKGLSADGKFVPFKENHWSGRDTVLILLALAAAALALYVHFYHGGTVTFSH